MNYRLPGNFEYEESRWSETSYPRDVDLYLKEWEVYRKKDLL